MDDPKDLHICGHCRKIFDNVELFITHKSGCNQPQINTETQPNNQIILESEIFPSVDLLDPTAFGHETFPLILQYENEEVVGETSSSLYVVYDENLHDNDDLNDVSYSLQPSKNVNGKEYNEEVIANLLMTQLSKEVISKGHNLQINQDNNGENTKACEFDLFVSVFCLCFCCLCLAFEQNGNQLSRTCDKNDQLSR